MTEISTQEKVIKFCKKLGYEIVNIDDYKNKSAILYLKDEEGYVYQSRYRALQNNHKPHKFYKTNPYTIQNIKLWMKSNTEGYELLSEEYIGSDDKLLFKCPKGHKFKMCWSSFQQGQRCSVCTNRQVLKGYNDIATTNPWMIDLGMSKEDAETHSYGSHDKVEVTCPYCGNKKKMSIATIYTYKSIQCICGDGISYSEKFVISMLNQLNIKYIKEYYPRWSNSKRYDFYLQDYNCIIECHGSQHYNESGFKLYGGKNLQEEQDNDKYKKELALENGIKYYIELDCRESNLKYIKNSILASELNNLCDLIKIDWLQCEEYALSNRVKEVCNYWHLHNEVNNEDLTTTDVGKIFNLSRITIAKYLKQGVKLGWCNYNSKEEIDKNNKKVGLKSKNLKSKPLEMFKNGKSLGIFESCMELERQSEKLFGVKLLNSSISQVCCGKKQKYKGFTFKYIK